MGALRTVSVKIGKLELPFVFDTAGGDTFVTPAVASAVGCTPYRRLVLSLDLGSGAGWAAGSPAPSDAP
jgi:hypothetical protein